VAAIILGVLLGVPALSCSGSLAECRVGADCASGACGADGRCLPVGGGDGGPAADARGGADGSSPGDGWMVDGQRPLDGGRRSDAVTGGDGGGTCTPNHDWRVTRAELPLRPGLHATFRVASNATVDTAGNAQPGGARRWDLSAAMPGDHLLLAELQALSGKWFAPHFPEATYAARLTDGDDLLGVFQVSDDQLLLLGVVSPEDGLLRTLLTYDPPVAVLSLPLAVGSAWRSQATVSGTLLGVVSYYPEEYDSQVDAFGTVVSPFGELEVLRVRVVMTRTLGFLPIVVRSFLFVAECFGTVATLRSGNNESEVEFQHASEVWRLAR
jgi:hypothetical protein